MKKFKTYGKVKSKNVIRSNHWDALKETKNYKIETIDLRSNSPETTNSTSQVNGFIDDFDKLSLVPQSTPVNYHDVRGSCDLSSPLLISSFEEEEEKEIEKEEKRKNIIARKCINNSTILISSGSLNEEDCKKDDTKYSSSLSSTTSFRRTVSFVKTKKKNNFKKKVSVGILSESLGSLLHSTNDPLSPGFTFKDALCCMNNEEILLNLCEQSCAINIEEYVKSSRFIRKLGEGSFSDVYEKLDKNNVRSAIKVIPFGCEDSSQISLMEVLPEIAISKKLSELGKEGVKGFIEVHKVLYCKGVYPSILTDLWEKWDAEFESENDHPSFKDCQKYVILETNYGGVDLEHFPIKTFKQSLFILKKIITALAAAEDKLEFEHRDLHWGNVLIEDVQDTLNVNIIDFTMSRLVADNCVVYTDSGKDLLLFQGNGDIQFDVYRQMKLHNENDWKSYNPITNVLWVRYLCEKLISKLDPSRRSTLQKFIARFPLYKSCSEILQKDVLMRRT